MGILVKMTHVTTKEKWRIIIEWERTRNITRVSKNLRIRYATCHFWIARHRLTGGVEDAPGRGRKPILSEEASKQALELLLSNKLAGAEEVALRLTTDDKRNVLVHRTTLGKAAREQAMKTMGRKLKVVKGKPKVKLLGGDTVMKRLAYCKAMKGSKGGWSHVLFTDRCKFAHKYPGCVVQPQQYILEGDTRAATMVNHPKVFNLYAGICKYGVTEVVEVAGTSGSKSEYVNKKDKEARNITANEYCDVLSKGLLPSALKIFRNVGQSSFVLLQDNDPTHNVASGVLKEFNRKHNTNITLLKHPPNSPDLNPIENVWGYVQKRVDLRGCETFAEFKIAVREELKNIPPAMLKTLVESMKRRLVACENAKGQRTKY